MTVEELSHFVFVRSIEIRALMVHPKQHSARDIMHRIAIVCSRHGIEPDEATSDLVCALLPLKVPMEHLALHTMTPAWRHHKDSALSAWRDLVRCHFAQYASMPEGWNFS